MSKLLAFLLSVLFLVSASESPLSGKITFAGTKDVAGTYPATKSSVRFPSSPK